MIPPERIQRTLDESDLDILIASTPENVFSTSGMYCLATAGLGEPAFSIWSADAGGPYLVMPAREMSSLIDNNVDPADVYPYGTTNIYQSGSLSETDRRVLEFQNARDFDDPIVALATAVDEVAGGDRIALEREGFDPDSFEDVEAALADYNLERAADQLYDLRQVKTEEGVQCLRRAAEITEAAMEEAMATIEPGTTEQELATEFRKRVSEKGGEPVQGFLTVGFGERTAYTHPLPSDREIREGDLVRWDGGCTVGNYYSDIGRTFAYRSANKQFQQVYEALYAGLDAALGELEDGVDTGTVYEAGVEAVRSAGVGSLEAFNPFHLGHGIGVEIYDPPTIEPGAGRIQEGTVMCVEPPYNELGSGGFLIEDEVLVTADGHEKLTDADETLPIVD